MSAAGTFDDHSARDNLLAIAKGAKHIPEPQKRVSQLRALCDYATMLGHQILAIVASCALRPTYSPAPMTIQLVRNIGEHGSSSGVSRGSLRISWRHTRPKRKGPFAVSVTDSSPRSYGSNTLKPELQ